ncbi:Uncharacterised protein [Mycobacteroides abscessus subsp. abscessus]|nr:Uncharacterised protein [Mycobacteroides abscessus subsp. abscessus]
MKPAAAPMNQVKLASYEVPQMTKQIGMIDASTTEMTATGFQPPR